jgi:hypothetical protein
MLDLIVEHVPFSGHILHFLSIKQVFTPVDKIELKEHDFVDFGFDKALFKGSEDHHEEEELPSTRGAKAVIKYMKWRHKALNLAVVMGMLTTVLVIAQFSQKWGKLTAAARVCDEALVDVTPAVSTTGRRLDDGSEAFFSNKYGYNLSLSDGQCAYVVESTKVTRAFSSLMGQTVENNSLILEDTSKTQLCGTFSSSCSPENPDGFKLKFNSDPASVAGTKATALSCATGSHFCGRVASTTVCLSRTLLEHLLLDLLRLQALVSVARVLERGMHLVVTSRCV